MDKTALLKKVRALAEHGVGGEAENAEKLLDRNEDAFAALSQEFERSSRILAEEWAQTSALAKIAVISESND